jgi:branched-chain amino acid transport system permease protein
LTRERLLGWSTLIAAAAIPLIATDYWLYLLTLMAIYGIVALGLNLLTGLSGQISLGHAGFFALGAYVANVLASKYAVPFPLAAALAAAAGWAIGFLVGIPAVRLQGLYLAIATLAFGIGVERAIYAFKGLTGGPYGLMVNSPSGFGFVANSPTKLYYLSVVVAALSVLFVSNVVRSSVGRRMIAMRDSELAAASMGVNVPRLKVLTFAFSASLAALGGVLYAPALGFISVEQFTLWLSITFISLIVIGGLGSIPGSFLGAAFVVLVPELLRGLGTYFQIVYGLAMILVFVFWPTGLIGLVTFVGRRAHIVRSSSETLVIPSGSTSEAKQ